ncbi:MAG TPA: hypothetical protein VG406_28650, partial [Isosphaeraceae bacterium]|nr:hypothetical protein [Isosphaeraceae bacterium]
RSQALGRKRAVVAPAAILVAFLISFPAPKIIPEFRLFFAESSRPASGRPSSGGTPRHRIA